MLDTCVITLEMLIKGEHRNIAAYLGGAIAIYFMGGHIICQIYELSPASPPHEIFEMWLCVGLWGCCGICIKVYKYPGMYVL